MTTNNNIIDLYENNNQNIERLNNNIVLEAGAYCRAKKSIKVFEDVHGIIGKDEVLLISELKFVGDDIHSVIVRPHPRWYEDHSGLNPYQFLVEDFLDKFDIVSREEGSKIRSEEVAQIHLHVQKEQLALMHTQSDPVKMMKIAHDIYSRRIENKADIGIIPTNGEIDAIAVIEHGVTDELLNNLKGALEKPQDLINIQAQWLAEQSSRIQKIFNSVIPYLTESSKALTSSMQDIKIKQEKQLQGIETLSLYTGKEVDILTIKTGRSAPDSEKLTLVQEILFADAELSLHHSNAVHFDYRFQDKLWNEFKSSQAFVDQVFPTQRCIVLMRSNYKEKDYGDSFENKRRNEENTKVFILVRNGENIHVLFSPISTHLHSARLFPAKDELERHLFKGEEKIQINIDDLSYSDQLNLIELEILHYKRFLILIAGLDHREQLFGDFYPKNKFMEMFYPEFQKKYFNFIHDSDGEGMLPTSEEKTRTLSEYLQWLNSRLTKGSRVIFNTKALIDVASAPSCYKNKNSSEPRQVYYPEEKFLVGRIQCDKHGFYLKVPVRSEYAARGQFEARVAIGSDVKATDLICLDLILPDQLDFYIKSRRYRKAFIEYIEIFKYGKKYIEQQQKDLGPMITYFDDSISHIHDCNLTKIEKRIAVLESINTWATQIDDMESIDPSSDKGRVIYTHILNQLQLRASPAAIEEKKYHAEQLADRLGIVPLKLCVDHKANLWLYSELPVADHYTQIEPNRFVLRSLLNITKTGKTSLKSESIVLINQYSSEEHIMTTWNKEIYDMYNDMNLNAYYTLNDKKQYFRFMNYHSYKSLVEAVTLGKELITGLFNELDYDIQVAKTIIDCYLKQTRENEKNGHKDKKINITFPILYGNDNLYRLVVENTQELFLSLIDKYNLSDYIRLEHAYQVKKVFNHIDYSPKFTIDKFFVNYERSSYLINTYKQTISFENLLCNFYWGQEINSSIPENKAFEKYITPKLLSSYVPNILDYLKNSGDYWLRNNLDITEIKNIVSSFDLKEIADYKNFNFDKIVGNPAYTPDLKFKDAEFFILSRTLKNSSTIVDLEYRVYVADAGNIKVSKKKMEEEWSFKEDNFHKISIINYSLSNLAGFKDVEVRIENIIASQKNSFHGSFDSLSAKQLFKFKDITSLKDMKIINEEDDLIIFQY